MPTFTALPVVSGGIAKRVSCGALALVLLTQTTSCGLLVSGSQRITLSSDPDGAEVKMDGMPQGVTPMTLRVSRREEPIFRFEKEGFRTEQRSTSREPNTIFILDIIGGVLILVPFLGLLGPGGWDIEPGNISVVLRPETPEAVTVQDLAKPAESTTITTTLAPQSPGTSDSTGKYTISEIKLDLRRAKPGDTISVTITLKPQGQSSPTGSPPTAEVFIHRDGKDLKQQSAPARLTSDGTYEAETEFTLPILIQSGDYEVRVVVPPGVTGETKFTVTQ